jgi:hypothetical protein
MAGIEGEGGVFSTWIVESNSKKESVLMFLVSALGLRRRLVDKLLRAATGGFVRAGWERTGEWSGRWNRMLLMPRTILGPDFLEGERDLREGRREKPWSVFGMQ